MSAASEFDESDEDEGQQHGVNTNRLGKTGYFTMYMLFMRSLAENPKLVKPRQLRKVFQNPVMVILFPTNGVEDEMICIELNLCNDISTN